MEGEGGKCKTEGDNFNSPKSKERDRDGGGGHGGHGEKSSHGSKQNHSKSNGQKSSRPVREIYRPPSLRSKSGRNANNNAGNQNQNPSGNSHKGNNPSYPNKSGHNHQNLSSVESSLHHSHNHSPHVNRRQFPFANGNIGTSAQGRNLNVNVNPQEFQLTASQQQLIQNQQLANLLQMDPSFYGDILATTNQLGIYSLQQSKSLGNNLHALIQQQQQGQQGQFNNGNALNYGIEGALAFLQTQRSAAILAANNNNNFSRSGQNPEDSGSGGGQFNRLSLSKSSGSIPDSLSLNKPRVRFDLDSDALDEATANMIKNTENRFSHLNMNGVPQQRMQISPQKQQLQKSRTGFVLNLHAHQQQSQSIQVEKCFKQSQPNGSIYQGAIKRSRSFGMGSQRQSGVNGSGDNWRSQSTKLTSPVSVHSVYSDFQISKWPKGIQEMVTAAVTAVDRVPARQQIEMVNMIFDAMLTGDPAPSENLIQISDNEAPAFVDLHLPQSENNNIAPTPTPEEKGKDCPLPVENESLQLPDDGDLSTPAVHIFLYFIQKEKDRTVMESLLNTCFATFQKLFGTNPRPSRLTSTTPNIFATQSMTFLRFISSLFSQVKLLRRQKPGGRPLDEMSFSVLSILCDSCLAMLRSQLSSDPESMGCLFTVLTSQGRDIESNFPLKMKQLLAAVRDALLGIGPYSQGPLCSTVQKTLMQLIELHAAAWALPASAVRYYYSNGPHHVKNNLSLASSSTSTT